MTSRTQDMSIMNDGTYNQYGPINIYTSGSAEKKKPFTNKNLIIPFTMSKANSAQGGTYVPRDDLLAKIEESFKTERIIFLSGMGGCGKSELARAYGYKHRDDFEEIFWLTCDDGEIPNFMGIMEKASYKIEQSDIEELSGKSLIIVDNCNIEDGAFLTMLEYGTGKARILVTTRLSLMGGYESFVFVESDDPETFAYSIFERNYCKKPKWGKAKILQNEEEGSILEICRAVQYNTMVVSLIGIRLREYSSLSISDCAKKVRSGIGAIKGEIKYSKDQKTRSEEIKDILEFLFSDILNYPFSEEQKAVLTVLSLTSSTWYEMDYVCSLLGEISNEYAVRTLLDFGWLQGNGDRLTIHPLIAEVISDYPIIISESAFFESILENYLGLPIEYLRKEHFLINKVLKCAEGAIAEVRLAVMMLLNHGGYKQLFTEIHPEVKVSYFVYANHEKSRFFMFQDLCVNETATLVEVPCQEEGKGAELLKVYNTCVPYILDLNVPFKGERINTIPEGLCWHDTNIRGLILPITLNTIGKSAFSVCSGLSGELRLPDSLTSIGSSAFEGCSGFSGDLHLPDSLTSIGSSAFEGCSGFSGDLHLPNSLTSIGYSAFRNCIGFSGDLHLPDRLTSIGNYAFEDCSGFSGKLHLPNSLTSIGSCAFNGCNGFSGELHLPNNLMSIGSCAFCNCNGFSGELHLPDSLTSIGEFAFEGCSGFNGELHLPDSLTSIGDFAFQDCSGFSGELHLPNSLTSIGYSAFRNCKGFSGELHLPDSLTSIGNYAFEDCSGFSGELHLPNSLTSIGSCAFNGCKGFSGELHLPNNLMSIGSCAFCNCSGFSGELHLPDSLTSIGYSAFRNCKGFSGELHLPNSLTSIGRSAFYNCPRLFCRTENVPNNIWDYSLYESEEEEEFELLLVNTLPEEKNGRISFDNCISPSKEVVLPNLLEIVGSYAFSGHSELHGMLNLPKHLKIIDVYAFRGCSGLSGELHLPDSLTSIGDFAFEGCSGLSGELHLPDSLTSIGDSAFEDCSGFSGKLRLPNSLTSIGSSAFKGCNGFSGELCLPNNLTSIRDSAFSGCSGLSGKLHIPESVSSIGVNAFIGCDKIKKVIFHNSKTTIDNFLSAYSDLIIVGYRHSTAEAFAREHGLLFDDLVEEE